MNSIVVTQDLAADRMRVVRGPDWDWADQDGGEGGVGTIRGEAEKYWVRVEWDNGTTRSYRVGANGKYDLAVYNPFISKPSPKAQRLTEVRNSLEGSIKKGNSLIEKSNTNGNSNTTKPVNITSTGAIKVRRPSCKIKGSEGRSS